MPKTVVEQAMYVHPADCPVLGAYVSRIAAPHRSGTSRGARSCASRYRERILEASGAELERRLTA